VLVTVVEALAAVVAVTVLGTVVIVALAVIVAVMVVAVPTQSGHRKDYCFAEIAGWILVVMAEVVVVNGGDAWWH